MRVLQLISSSGFGGAESVVALLAAELAALPVAVTVAVLHSPHAAPRDLARALETHGVRFVGLPCAGRVDPRPLLRLVRLLRRERIDVLHSHGYKANAFGLLAAHLAGCRLVTTCHNWTERTPALRRYRSLDVRLLRRVDRVIAVSPSVAATLIGHGFPPGRVSVIPNGIRAEACEGAALAAPDPLPLTIGAVARLSPEKGLDVVVRALPLIARQQPDVRCIVAGDGPERPVLERLADELGVRSRLTFAGFVGDIPAFLCRCTVVVQPSRTEGMPLAVLEAMAAGRAIVATAVGDVPGLLRHGDAGLLVPPDDPEGMADAVLRLLGDGGLRTQLGAGAAAEVRAHYTAAAMARSYADMYTAVLAHSRDRQATGTAAAGWERAR